MATSRQIEYRIKVAKKKLAKLNKEKMVLKERVKGLEGYLKKKKKTSSQAKPKTLRVATEAGAGPGKPYRK